MKSITISSRYLFSFLIICFSFQITSAQQFQIQEITPFLGRVHGMTMDNDGVLYYSDTYSKSDDISRVYMLNPPYTGNPIATEVEGFSIGGLLWENDKLHVAFLNKNEIVIYDKNLEFLESRPVDSPINFASDGSNIYVVSYFGLVGIVTNNRVRIHLEDLELPFDILYSGKESLWVSEKGKNGSPGRVSEIAYEGVITNILEQNFKDPAGLGMDQVGNLYIADKGDNKIYMVNPENQITLVSDKYTSPICVIPMPDGRMMVNTNHEGGMLLIISPIN
jgi:DNA-binding beta-propeller fold protein YncE